MRTGSSENATDIPWTAYNNCSPPTVHHAQTEGFWGARSTATSWIEHGDWKATFQPKDGSPGLPAGGTYLTVYARLSDGSVRMIRAAIRIHASLHIG